MTWGRGHGSVGTWGTRVHMGYRKHGFRKNKAESSLLSFLVNSALIFLRDSLYLQWSVFCFLVNEFYSD